MANWNRFGATYSKVIEMFPGSVVTDYATNGITGDVVIGNVMDRITRDLMRSLPPSVFESMFQVDTEMIVRSASAGQMTANLGIAPIIAGSLHLWRYVSLASLSLFEPSGPNSNGQPTDWAYRKPVKNLNEVNLADYTITASTGAIAFQGSISTGLGVGERVFGSYDIDVENAAFTMPSVADIIYYGTAAEMGSKLYSAATDRWALVTDYQARYAAIIADAKSGTWIPDEIRRLHHWTEIQPANVEVKSVRRYRG